MVARVLRNLKGIHASAEDWARALRVTDRLVALTPEIASEIRDRGHFYAQIEADAAAREDYKQYLTCAPDAEDTNEVRELVKSLRNLASPLN